MTELTTYLIWGAIPVVLAILVLAFKALAKKRAQSGENKFVANVLSQALEQSSSFDLKLLGAGTHAGLVTTLTAVSAGGLDMRAQGKVTDEWNHKSVEAYFRVRQDDMPVFFVFESTVTSLTAGADASEIVLAMPQHLRVEKKRHFIRARPDPKDILMIGVWPVSPGKRLPRANADLGHPPIAWKNGQKPADVEVQNISGSGLGLHFSAAVAGSLPFDAGKGRQLICLVVYRAEPGAPLPTVFWCTAEIMNVRSGDNGLSLGLEFTNWAIQAQGDVEIHWTHNSPWRGVKPILQWVQRIDKAQN